MAIKIQLKNGELFTSRPLTSNTKPATTNPIVAKKKQIIPTGPSNLNTLESLGYGAESVGQGITGFAEDLLRGSGALVNKGLHEITGLGGLAPNPVSNYFENSSKFLLADNLTEQWKTNSEARYNPSETDKWVGSINSGVSRMLPTVAIAALTGGSSTAASAAGAGTLGKAALSNPIVQKAATKVGSDLGLGLMGASAAGTGMGQQYRETGELDKSMSYGIMSGTVEVLTERITGGIPLLNKGWTDDFVEKAIAKVVKDPKLTKGLIKLSEIVGEGGEEAISAIVDPFIQRITVNPNAPMATMQDILSQAVMGSISAGLLQGGFKAATIGEAVTSKKNEIGYTKAVNNYLITEISALNQHASEQLNPEFRPEPMKYTKDVSPEQVEEYRKQIREALATEKAAKINSDDEIRVASPIAEEEISENTYHKRAMDEFTQAMKDVENKYGTDYAAKVSMAQVKAETGIDIDAILNKVNHAQTFDNMTPHDRLAALEAQGLADQYYPADILERHRKSAVEATVETAPGVNQTKSEFIAEAKLNDPTLTDSDLESLFAHTQNYETERKAENTKTKAKKPKKGKVNEFIEGVAQKANVRLGRFGVTVEVAYDFDRETNGSYNPKTKVLRINGNTIKGEGVANWVMAHEITHHAINNDPAILAEIKSLMESMGYNVDFEAFKQAANYQGEEGYDLTNNDDMNEEAVANFMSDLLNDDSVLSLAVETNPGFIEKLISYINNIFTYTKEDREAIATKKKIIARLQKALGTTEKATKPPKQDGPRIDANGKVKKSIRAVPTTEKLEEYAKEKLVTVPMLKAVADGLLDAKHASAIDAIMRNFPDAWKEHIDVVYSDQEFSTPEKQAGSTQFREGTKLTSTMEYEKIGELQADAKHIIVLFKDASAIDFVHQFGDFLYDRVLTGQQVSLLKNLQAKQKLQEEQKKDSETVADRDKRYKLISKAEVEADKEKRKLRKKEEDARRDQYRYGAHTYSYFSGLLENWWLNGKAVAPELNSLMWDSVQSAKNAYNNLNIWPDSISKDIAPMLADIIGSGEEYLKKLEYNSTFNTRYYYTDLELVQMYFIPKESSAVGKKNPNRVEQGISNNSKTGMSYDPSNNCPKKQEFADYIMKYLADQNLPLTSLVDPEFYARIYDEAVALGKVVPCSYCYVEEARRKALALQSAGKKITSVNFAQAKQMVESYPYKDAILNFDEDTISYVNKRGGLRIFSFSDFTKEAAPQILKALRDLQTKKGGAKAISKQLAFVDKFGHMGFNIQLSVDSDGRDFADVDYTDLKSQGVDWDDAARYASEYPNVKVRSVAKTIKEVLAMLDLNNPYSNQPLISVITPFHAGTNDETPPGWDNLDSDKSKSGYDNLNGKSAWARMINAVKAKAKQDGVSEKEYLSRLCCAEGGKCFNEKSGKQCSTNCGIKAGYLTIPNVDAPKEFRGENLILNPDIKGLETINGESVTAADLKNNAPKIADLSQLKDFGEDVGPAVSLENWTFSEPAESAVVKWSKQNFGDQIDQVLNGKFPKGNALYVGQTPPRLQSLGLGDIPILFQIDHVVTTTTEKSKDNVHLHGLDVDFIKDIRRYLEWPVMVIDLPEDNKLMAILYKPDSFGLPITAILRPWGRGKADGEYYEDATFICTVYGRDIPDVNKHIAEALRDNRMLYYDKAKVEKMASITKMINPATSLSKFKSGEVIQKSTNAAIAFNSFVNTDEKKSKQGPYKPNAAPEIGTEYVRRKPNGETFTLKLIDFDKQAMTLENLKWGGTNRYTRREYLDRDGKIAYGLPDGDASSAVYILDPDYTIYPKYKYLDFEKQITQAQAIKEVKSGKKVGVIGYNGYVYTTVAHSIHHEEEIADEISSMTEDPDSEFFTSKDYEMSKETSNYARRYEIPTTTEEKWSKQSNSDGTKLTEDQGEFFKDSKVVDENGNLKVTYHGTARGGFTIFDPKYLKTKGTNIQQGIGFYFTDTLKWAKEYLTTTNVFTGKESKRTSDSQMYKVYLNIENPIVLTRDGRTLTDKQVYDIISRGNYDWGKDHFKTAVFRKDKSISDEEVYQLFIDRYKGKPDQELMQEMGHWYHWENAKGFLENFAEITGYDGVSYNHQGQGNIYVAFNSNQIKETTNLHPTKDPDIRYSFTKPSGLYSKLEKEIEDKVYDNWIPGRIMSIIRKAGVREDEIKWSGIETYLSDKKTVKKEELLIFLKENALEIKEIHKGAGAVAEYTPEQTKELEDLNSRMGDILSQIAEKYKEHTGKEIKLAVIGYGQIRQSHELNNLWSDAGLPDRDWLNQELRKTHVMQGKIEQIVNESSNDTQSKWDTHTLEGGEEHKNFLITLPGIKSGNKVYHITRNGTRFLPSSYMKYTKSEAEDMAALYRRDDPEHGDFSVVEADSDDPAFTHYHWANYDNVLTHARTQDFTTLEGERALTVIEVQSDWHQQGSKTGYVDKQHYNNLEEVEAIAKSIGKKGIEDISQYELEQTGARRELVTWFGNYLYGEEETRPVVDAPYKDTWHELTMKKLLQHAVENDYDRLAWVSPELVPEVEKWGNTLEEIREDEDLTKAYGATINVYEKTIPRFMAKYVKQWGVNVEETNIIVGDIYKGPKKLSLDDIYEHQIQNVVGVAGKYLTPVEDPGSIGVITEFYEGEYLDESEAYEALFQGEVIYAFEPELAQGLIELNIEDANAGALDFNSYMRATGEFRSSSKPRTISSVKITQEMKDSILAKGQEKFSKQKDSDGTKLTDDQLKFYEGVQAVDENGNLQVVYHGTGEDFTEFKYTQDIGFHFGTKEQATNQANYKATRTGLSKVDAYYLNIKNPIVTDDAYAWYLVLPTLRALVKANAITQEESDKISARIKPDRQRGALSNEQALKSITQLLKAKGYDGVIYDNAAEGDGKSYIVFDSNQAKLTSNLNPTKDPDIRLSKQNEATGKALFSEERFNGFGKPYLSFEELYTAGKKDYAKGMVAMISPSDYLSLTAGPEQRARIEDTVAKEGIDENYAGTKQDAIRLYYNGELGRVTGHEGRHRMQGLMNAGYTNVAIVISEDGSRAGGEKIDHLVLRGQHMGYTEDDKSKYAPGRVVLEDIVPISRMFLDEVKAKFVDAPAELKYAKQPKTVAQHQADWLAAKQQYGTKPTGKGPVDPSRTGADGVPEQMNDWTRVSDFMRSVWENPNTPDSFLTAEMIGMLCGTGSYFVMNDPNAIRYADQQLKKFGVEECMKRWKAQTKAGKALNKNDLVLGEQLLIDLADNGKVSEWEDMVAELAVEATRAGQNLQAFSLLKKLSPSGREYKVRQFIRKLQAEIDERNARKGSTVILAIKQEMLDRLRDCKKIADPKAREEAMDAIEEEIIIDVAGQIPPTISDRIVAWRYLAMLGNLRTHNRNIVSNTIMMVTRQLKDTIAAGIETAVDQATGGKMDRTKTAFVSIRAPQDYKDFANQDYLVMKDIISNGSKFDAQDMLFKYKRSFGKSWLGNLAEKAAKFNGAILEKEDNFGIHVGYKSAMLQYMMSNKLSPAFLSSGTRDANGHLAQARAYAMLEAQKAVYREASDLADWLSKAERSHPIAKVIVGGLLPFKRTPINILKRGVQYSPLGLAYGLTAELYAVKAGKRTAAQAIDTIASGLTGTMMFAVGYWMAMAGLIKAGGGEDEKKEAYDQMLGEQPYSVNILGRSYTVDWLTPTSMPLLAGVEYVQSVLAGDEEFTINQLLSALLKTTDPVTELSFLQGFNNAISSYSENKLLATAVSTTEGYIGQFIPTVFGQGARIIDKTRRDAYSPKGSTPGDVGYFVNKMENKIPGASFSNEPTLDLWGRVQTSDPNLAVRTIDTAVMPYYTKSLNKTPIDVEINKVFAVNKNNAVVPGFPANKVTIDSVDYVASAEERTELRKTKGQTSYNLLGDVFKSNAYKGMSQEQKEKVIADVYTYAGAVAKEEFATSRGIDYSEKIIESVKLAKDAGINIGTYFAVQQEISTSVMKADLDRNGNPITRDRGKLLTRKTKVVDYLDNLGLDRKQKNVFLQAQDYKVYGGN